MYVMIRLILLATVAVAIYACWLAVMAWPWIVLALLVLVLVTYRKRRALTECGTAQWATLREVERAGMTGGTGMCVGVMEE